MLTVLLLLFFSSIFAVAIPETKKARLNVEWIELPIDHFGGSDAGTFRNRYWVDETFFKEGGPVFLVDNAEWDAQLCANKIVRERFNVRQMAKTFDALLICWEHRYFGQSLPFRPRSPAPAKEMQYLSMDQALADLAVFAKQFKRTKWPEWTVSPDKTPWVMFGASFSGVRAAIMRKKYPEIIFAAYAAGAATQTRKDMSAFWDTTYAGIAAQGFGACAKDLTAGIQRLDWMIRHDRPRLQRLKFMAFGASGRDSSDESFGDALSAVISSWMNAGMGRAAKVTSLRSLCGHLTTDPASFPNGYAAVKGARYTLSRWATWPGLIAMAQQDSRHRCFRPVVRRGKVAKVECSLDSQPHTYEDLGWYWLSLQDTNHWINAHNGPTQLAAFTTDLEDPNTVEERNEALFPGLRRASLLPKEPNVDLYVERYGGWSARPTNTMWSMGEFDPWIEFSHFSRSHKWSPSFPITATVPGCGRSTGKAVFGLFLDGAVHCEDLGWKEQYARPGRILFTRALRTWLPGFKKERELVRRGRSVGFEKTVNGMKNRFRVVNV